MSTRPYTEDPRVEQPAKRLMAELGWSLEQPHPHPDPLPVGERAAVDETGTFGREMKGEVVLVSRLRSARNRFPEVGGTGKRLTHYWTHT